MTPIISLPAALLACFGLASCGGGAELTINPGAAQAITGGGAPVESAGESDRASPQPGLSVGFDFVLCSSLSNYHSRISQLRRQCALPNNILHCFDTCFEFFELLLGQLHIQLSIFRNEKGATSLDRERIDIG